MDPQIQNILGTTNLGFYRKHKYGILPYFVIRNSTRFYNLECEKALREIKIHKKNGCENPKANKFTYLRQKYSKSLTKNVRMKGE